MKPSLDSLAVSSDYYSSMKDLLQLTGYLACFVQEANKILGEKFKSGKNKWFFTKLRF